jgi:NADH-quinone oxidoreductase subunit F
VSGRRRPVPTGEIQRIECDSVIFAVGETVDAGFTRTSGLRLRENGTIDVNRFSLETSRARFYAGGDVISGASNVTSAMALGKSAARNIDRQLMESDRWMEMFRELEFGQVVPASPTVTPRQTGRMLEATDRVRSAAEVVHSLAAEEALEEVQRCLRCDLTFSHEN